MADRPNGGLSGKARRVHFRARCARKTADEWIEEYVCGPVVDVPAARAIPVRHRSARLAALTALKREPTIPRNAQLRLPFDTSPNDAKVKPMGAVLTTPDVAWKPTRRGPDDDPVKKPLEARAGEPTPDVTSSGEGQEFTMPRFLLGCLMGGAAAAAILLTFRMITG
jgi:hypothetical protein